MEYKRKRKKIIICIVFVFFIICIIWPQSSEFDDKAALEEFMEIQIPNYEVKEYISDNSIDIHGDFTDKINIEFDSIPSRTFIDRVKCKVNEDKNKEEKRWLTDGKHGYTFQASYGDGGKVPNSRKEQDDWFVRLDFYDNSKKAVIEYGHW
jgi:hypothetical protein